MWSATTLAFAQPGTGAPLPDSTGTGPFSAIKEIDSCLPDQVVYRPGNMDALGGANCGLCTSSEWEYESKNFDSLR